MYKELKGLVKDKDLENLMKKVTEIVAKADVVGYEFNNIEIGAIKRISHAKTMDSIGPEAYHIFNSTYQRIMLLK